MRKLLLIILTIAFVSASGQTPMSKLIRKKASAASSTAFVTGQTLGADRNNYGDFVGFKMTIGASPITVTDLGRWIVSGNSGTHTLKIVDPSNVTIVSASLNTSGQTAGAFAYVSVTPTVLSAGTVYYVFSLESNGGDHWYQDNTSLTTTSAATINNSAYGTPIGDNNVGSVSYVPVSFKYY